MPQRHQRQGDSTAGAAGQPVNRLGLSPWLAVVLLRRRLVPGEPRVAWLRGGREGRRHPESARRGLVSRPDPLRDSVRPRRESTSPSYRLNQLLRKKLDRGLASQRSSVTIECFHLFTLARSGKGGERLRSAIPREIAFLPCWKHQCHGYLGIKYTVARSGSATPSFTGVSLTTIKSFKRSLSWKRGWGPQISGVIRSEPNKSSRT